MLGNVDRLNHMHELWRFIATVFGVFLGSWVNSIRDRRLKQRSQRELIHTAVLEVMHCHSELKAIVTGVAVGNLLEVSGASVCDIVPPNVPTFSIAKKAFQDFRITRKAESGLLFAAMQRAGNAEKLSSKLRQVKYSDDAILFQDIDLLLTEYIALAWAFRNIILCKDVPLTKGKWEKAMDRNNQAQDIRAFFRES